MRLVSLVLVLWLLGPGSSYAAEKVVFSESFETPQLTTTNYPAYNGKWVNFGSATSGYDTGANAPVGTSFIGGSGLEWTVTLGNIDLVDSSNFQAAEGSQSINLNGFEQGALATSAEFPAPGRYTLVFALSKNPTGVDEAKVEVSLDNVELAGSPYSFSNSVTAESMNYRYVSVSFSVATAGTHTLQFKSLNTGSPNGYGPVIDDITVSRKVMFAESFETPLLNTTNFPEYNGKWVNYGVATAGYDTGANAPVGTTFVGGSGLQWSATLGNIDLVDASNFEAADGSQSINLNGFEQGALATSVVFPAAGNYTLVFALSKNPTGVAEAIVEVSVDDVEVTGSPFSFDSSVTAESMNYRYVSVSFSVATAGTRTLQFKSLNTGSPNGYGPVIDDITVSREVLFAEGFETPQLNTSNFPEYNGKWVNYGVATAGYDTGANAPVGTSFVGGSGLQWSATLGNIDLVDQSNFQAADGSQSINLNGFEQGALATSVVFPEAGSYTLVFALSENPTGVDEAKVEVSVDDVEVTGSPFSFDSSVTAESMNYRYVSVNFSVSTAGTHTLQFKSLNTGSPNGYGPVIDDISVSREVIFAESFETPQLNTTNFPEYNGKWVNYGVATAGYDAGANAPVGTSFVGGGGLEWSATLGNIDLVDASNFQAADGSQSINLNGFEQGALATSVAFPSAGGYTLVFALSKNPTGVDEAIVEVSVDDVPVTGSPFSFASSVTARSMNYRYVSASFSVATAGTHSLKFTSLNTGSPNGYGPVIDDLVVSKSGIYAVEDSDSDGYPNYRDSFPLDAAEVFDTDSDGKGNNADLDDDGDGVNDTGDAFALDASETLDTDGDGIGNNADGDDDGDGLSDAAEVSLGTDPLLTDSDSDGSADNVDAFPTDATETIDTDTDGIGNNADTDDDGDGTDDASDAFPLDSSENIDSDKDGIGNNTDTDDDGDGVSDIAESALGTDPLLTDSDSDGVSDVEDAFPLDATEALDTDADGIGNNADTDDDGDGIADSDENMTGTNPLLADTDADGTPDGNDLFPLDASESLDTDEDGIGNNADSDDDGDGFSDAQEEIDGTDSLNKFSCQAGCFSFDIDDNLGTAPLTDGLLVIRHLFGFTGDTLIASATDASAMRNSADDISAYLKAAESELDIDGSGDVTALTDGLLLIRYLFGFSGDSLISGAVGTNATRTTSTEIQDYIKARVTSS